MTTKTEYSLKKTSNNNYRVLINGAVHPLLCGIESVEQADQRLKERLGIEFDTPFIYHRFDIGEKYVFLAEKFQAKDLRMSRRFHPWCDEFHRWEIAILECISQHDVPGEWDDEIKYKGYKFKLVWTNVEVIPKDALWYNQYPRASYGQLDTSADYYASPVVTDKETIDLMIAADVGRGFGGYFEEAGAFVGSILRGVRNLAEEKANSDVEHAEFFDGRVKSLQDYLAKFEKQLDELGFKSVTTPIVFRDKDTGESKSYPDITTTDVILK